MGHLSEQTLLFLQEILERMTVTCLSDNALAYTRTVQTAAQEIAKELDAKRTYSSISGQLGQIRGGQSVEFNTYGSSVGKNGSGGREAASV